MDDFETWDETDEDEVPEEDYPLPVLPPVKEIPRTKRPPLITDRTRALLASFPYGAWNHENLVEYYTPNETIEDDPEWQMAPEPEPGDDDDPGGGVGVPRGDRPRPSSGGDWRPPPMTPERQRLLEIKIRMSPDHVRIDRIPRSFGEQKGWSKGVSPLNAICTTSRECVWLKPKGIKDLQGGIDPRTHERMREDPDDELSWTPVVPGHLGWPIPPGCAFHSNCCIRQGTLESLRTGVRGATPSAGAHPTNYGISVGTDGNVLDRLEQMFSPSPYAPYCPSAVLVDTQLGVVSVGCRQRTCPGCGEWAIGTQAAAICRGVLADPDPWIVLRSVPPKDVKRVLRYAREHDGSALAIPQPSGATVVATAVSARSVARWGHPVRSLDDEVTRIGYGPIGLFSWAQCCLRDIPPGRRLKAGGGWSVPLGLQESPPDASERLSVTV